MSRPAHRFETELQFARRIAGDVPEPNRSIDVDDVVDACSHTAGRCTEIAGEIASCGIYTQDEDEVARLLVRAGRMLAEIGIAFERVASERGGRQ